MQRSSFQKTAVIFAYSKHHEHSKECKLTSKSQCGFFPGSTFAIHGLYFPNGHGFKLKCQVNIFRVRPHFVIRSRINQLISFEKHGHVFGIVGKKLMSKIILFGWKLWMKIIDENMTTSLAFWAGN